MLTNCRLLNIEKVAIKRSIELSKLKGLTKNLKTEDEFLVHVKDEYDYEIISEDRELILKLVNDAYDQVSGGAKLPIFGVNGKLSHYITTKKDMDAKTIKGLPPTEYGLEGEAAIKPVKIFWSQSSRPKEGKAAKQAAPSSPRMGTNELKDSKKKGGFLGFGGGEKKPAAASPRGGGGSKKAGYVPPHPPNGAEIPAPPVNAKVKTFKVSSGPCPPPLEIPNV